MLFIYHFCYNTLMQYKHIHKAIFLSRPNRFIAHVMQNGKNETVHVKNTGRCKELLVPGATVYLEEGENPVRKTKYDLIAVECEVTPDTLLAKDEIEVKL